MTGFGDGTRLSYRISTLQGLLLVGLGVVGSLLALVASINLPDNSGPIAVLVLLVVGNIVLIRYVSRGGVDVTPEGLRLKGMFLSSLLRWADIQSLHLETMPGDSRSSAQHRVVTYDQEHVRRVLPNVDTSSGVDVSLALRELTEFWERGRGDHWVPGPKTHQNHPDEPVILYALIGGGVSTVAGILLLKLALEPVWPFLGGDVLLIGVVLIGVTGAVTGAALTRRYNRLGSFLRRKSS